jgi:hypothetical protein
MQAAAPTAKTGRMSIHVYANCWNELPLLPYFIRHYDSFVERFTIIDDGSTDGSIEFLRRQPKVKLMAANRKTESYIDQARRFFNQAWKESRLEADWVIACNIDEHLYHQDIEAYLWKCKQEGITVLPANGYEMIALRFPSGNERLCDEVRYGASTEALTGPAKMHTKILAFNPFAIQEINFSAGRHEADPCGDVVYPDQIEAKLLHYKFLGLKYAAQRYMELRTGLSSADIESGRGAQYLWEAKKIRFYYFKVACAAFVVVNAGFVKDISLALSFLPLKLILPIMSISKMGSFSSWRRAWSLILAGRR